MAALKIPADSNCYFIEDKGMLIDTGREGNRRIVLAMIDPDKVKTVILTHLHYDHIGNVELFTKARFYASSAELACFKDMPFGTVLDAGRVKVLTQMKIHPLESVPGLKVIPCPGHTKGSIALWDSRKRILYSGDTLFERGVGRTDLPTSAPEMMVKTLANLKRLKHKTICPGHDY
jgi:hydroxyacylglutathione hydrolase